MKSNIDPTQRKTIIKTVVYTLIFILFFLVSSANLGSIGAHPAIFSIGNIKNAFSSGFGVVVLICLYFLPSILGRKKHNATAIFILNLLLGWTVICWIVALIWATTKDTGAIEEEHEEYPDIAEELLKFARLRDGGVITEEEFETRKKKLLEN